jgi:hypothetical protein
MRVVRAPSSHAAASVVSLHVGGSRVPDHVDPREEHGPSCLSAPRPLPAAEDQLGCSKFR